MLYKWYEYEEDLFMKTAISIPDDLFKYVEKLAKESHLSRSEIFADAVREFMEKRKSEKILEGLNNAYSETEQETELRKRSKKYYTKSLKAEKW